MQSASPGSERGTRNLGSGTPDRTDLWKQLSNVLTLTVAINQVYWTVFSIFWAANGVLLVALFEGGNLPANNFVGLLIAFVGIGLTITWRLQQRRALGHQERYEAITRRLETKLELAPAYAISRGLNTGDVEDLVDKKGPSIRKLVPICFWAWVTLWSGFAVYFLTRLS